MMLWTILGFAIGVSAVILPSGNYRGKDDGRTTVYYNIPYAHAGRFQPPQAVPRGRKVVDASKHGPACINFKIPPPYDIGFRALQGNQTVTPQTEDCLSLDIYVPNGHRGNLPILFFTPGGGWTVGASFLYDMRPLVERSVAMGKPFIGVAINYRVGPLGFLNPSQGANFNLGVEDQFAALKWIQCNAKAFGGDGHKITIMGESAGAESTLYQLLFADVPVRGAWIASAPSATPPFRFTQPTNKSEYVQIYAEACGCGKPTLQESVQCLSSVDTSVLVNQSYSWYAPGVSLGGVIAQNIFQRLRDPPHVPVMVSVCRDEATSQAIGFNSSSDNTTAQVGIESLTSALSSSDAARFQSEMHHAYPNDPAVGCPFDGQNTTYGQPSQYKRLAAIQTDATYVEPWFEYLHLFPNVYGMVFEEPIAGTDPAFGVQHASDLAYYFPSVAIGPLSSSLEAKMQAAVVDFVSNGDPGWAPFTKAQTVRAINASHAIDTAPPHRPGFDVIKNYIHPK